MKISTVEGVGLLSLLESKTLLLIVDMPTKETSTDSSMIEIMIILYQIMTTNHIYAIYSIIMVVHYCLSS